MNLWQGGSSGSMITLEQAEHNSRVDANPGSMVITSQVHHVCLRAQDALKKATFVQPCTPVQATVAPYYCGKPARLLHLLVIARQCLAEFNEQGLCAAHGDTCTSGGDLGEVGVQEGSGAVGITTCTGLYADLKVSVCTAQCIQVARWHELSARESE